MKKIKTLGLVLLILSTASCQNTLKEKEKKKIDKRKEISFYTPDSVKVFGSLYEISKSAPTILLFHQGGSNSKAEYNSIIPKLLNQGFNILAIDQRSGGQVYGAYNRTVANIPYNNFNYCDVYTDMETALVFIIESGFVGNKILWGSSYSGSLAIQLASKHQSKVSGVLAFSPASGGPMQACRPDQYFETLKIPLLLLRPSQEMEIESSKNQADLAKTYSHQVYVAQYGTHGSSMLVEERVENNVDENWKVVTSFLNELKN